ncbi:hypothetical protein B296_00041322, partial [Ensete ventricosum]
MGRSGREHLQTLDEALATLERDLVEGHGRVLWPPLLHSCCSPSRSLRHHHRDPKNKERKRRRRGYDQ